MNKQTRRGLARRLEKGMTLLEIMIVVAILGLLATVVVTNIMGQFDNAKIKLTRTAIGKLGGAVQNYYIDNDEFPSGGDGLRALVNPPGGFKAYVEESALKDAWGQPFIYRNPARNGNGDFEIMSKGPDRQEGTKDDIYAKR